MWKHQEQSKAVESLKLPQGMDHDLQKKFRELFSRHEQTFANSNMDLGCCTIGTHRINIGDAPPVKQRAYRHSRKDNEFVGETLDELKKHGIIEACESAWASPVVVVVKKEEGARRLCIDQRRVNDVTVTDSYPMPNAKALIDDLENTAVFSTLDMLSGFYQIPMDPADRDKTAFTTKQGLFRFTRMPFSAIPRKRRSSSSSGLPTSSTQPPTPLLTNASWSRAHTWLTPTPSGCAPCAPSGTRLASPRGWTGLPSPGTSPPVTPRPRTMTTCATSSLPSTKRVRSPAASPASTSWCCRSPTWARPSGGAPSCKAQIPL